MEKKCYMVLVEYNQDRAERFFVPATSEEDAYLVATQWRPGKEVLKVEYAHETWDSFIKTNQDGYAGNLGVVCPWLK